MLQDRRTHPFRQQVPFVVGTWLLLDLDLAFTKELSQEHLLDLDVSHALLCTSLKISFRSHAVGVDPTADNMAKLSQHLLQVHELAGTTGHPIQL